MKQPLIVGIDIAKKDFAVTYRIGEVEVELDTFTNDASGFQQLHAALVEASDRHGPCTIQLILEATGGYEAALMAYAYAQGWGVSLPNPKQVRDWAKGVGYRVKTDRVDARILAHYGVERHPPLRPQLAQEVSHLDSLLKRRQDLEQALHKEQTRLSEMAHRPGMAPPVLDSLEQVIDALTEALASIQQAIDELCQEHDVLRKNKARLLALPGVGPKVVLPLLVKLLQWQNLTAGTGDAAGLVALIGMDPQPYQSGQSVRKHPGISKMGDSELRRLLYMGALGGVGGNNPLKAFYQPLIGRGKAKKVALVAPARKILIWAWTIFSQQTDWDPTLHKIGA